MRPCSFDGCPNAASPKASRGLCNSHYWQLHKGRPLTPLAYRRNQSVPWLEAHVEHEGEECLIWPFRRREDGRGQVRYEGEMTTAHRLMCVFAHGEPPTPKHEAAHSCGKGHEGCVNPKHLRWATDKENKADMVGHGTRRQGETIPWAVLTERRVKAIREFAATLSIPTLADLFGLDREHVRKVVTRSIWRHI
jgi:hypothetical protein